MSGTEVANLYATIGVRMESLERGLARTETLMLTAANKTERHAKRMNKSLALIGGGLAGATILYAFGGMIRSAGNLDKTLSQLKAVTGANASQMDLYRKAAMLAGTTTQFSVGQAATAQMELAKAGLTTAQIMGGGFKTAMHLAAAGSMDLAEASKTVANAMNLFGIGASGAGSVADALATAANSTTADVSDFAMALTQGGTAAKAAGLSFNDTMLVLESLAKIGVKNSDAGTSMKSAILNLLTPSQKQTKVMKELGISFVGANGKFKDAVTLSGMLREKLGGLTQAQRTNKLATIAGSDGVRALLALYDAGPKTLKEWGSQLEQQGVAARQAKTMQDNLGTSIDKFRNSVEAGGISLATVFAPQIRAAADGIGSFIRDLENGGQAEAFAQGLSDAVGGISDAVHAASPALGLMRDVLSELGGRTIAVAIVSFVAMRAAVAGVTAAVGIARGAFDPLGGALLGLQVGVPILAMLVSKSKSASEAAHDWSRGLMSVQTGLDAIQGTRVDESVAAARLAVATAHKLDLENQLGKLREHGKGQTKNAINLQQQLNTATAETITAQKAYADAAGAPEKKLLQAATDFANATIKVSRARATIARIGNMEPAKTAPDQAARNTLLETARAIVAEQTRIADANRKIVASLDVNHLANQLANLRNDKGLQVLSERANLAVTKIRDLSNLKIALKFGNDNNPKVDSLVRRLARLAADADGFGQHPAVLKILGDSKNIEEAIKRIRRLIGSLPETTTTRLQGTHADGYAGGGRISGGTPGKDSVLSLLTPGEVVLNSTQQHLVANGYSIEEALRSTGAAYAKGKPAKGKPPIGGSATPGKVSASVPKATDDKAQAQWTTISTAQQIQMATNDRAITNAGQTKTKTDDTKAYNQRISMLTAWVAKINKFASSHSPLSQALKATIEGEKTSTFSGIAGARDSLKGLSPVADPTQLPASIDAALAQAELDGDTGKQVDVLRQAESWYSGQLGKKITQSQRASLLRAIAGTRKQITDLSTATSAAGASGAGATTLDAYALPDGMDATMALAELTSGTADDMEALTAEESFYAGKLAEAQAAGDQPNVAKMARALKGVRDQKTSLGAPSGGAGGGIQGSVFEGNGSTLGNLVGSLDGSGGGASSSSSSAGGGGTGGGGGGVVVNVTVQGNVMTTDGLASSLVEPIRAALISIGQSNGSIFGGYA